MLGSNDTINTLRPSIIDANIAAPEVTVAATNPILTVSSTTDTTTATAAATTTANPTTTTAAQYSVPVKSEYILPERPSSLPSTQRFLNESKNENISSSDKTTNGSNDRRDNNNERSQQQEPRNRKQRGKQNKKRPRDVKISDEHKICRAILRGEPCPYVTTTMWIMLGIC